MLTLSKRPTIQCIVGTNKHANYGKSFLRINSCGCRKIKSKNTRFTHESVRKILTSTCKCIINAYGYSEKNTPGLPYTWAIQ